MDSKRLPIWGQEKVVGNRVLGSGIRANGCHAVARYRLLPCISCYGKVGDLAGGGRNVYIDV